MLPSDTDARFPHDAGRRSSSQIADPTPARRRHIIQVLYNFVEGKVSLAELKGISREKLYQIAEIGHVKFKHGRVDEAENIFQALILLEHRNAFFHSVMGAIHQKKRRPVEAIYEYSLALKLDKNDIAARVNRGEIYLRHRNYRRAAEDFRAAILMDMSGRNIWANRARSLVIALKRSLDAEKARRARGRQVRQRMLERRRPDKTKQ